jgi:Flp pilus assembly protein TadG
LSEEVLAMPGGIVLWRHRSGWAKMQECVKSVFRRNIFVRFTRNDSGAVALMFGLAIVPLIIAVGVAIDYARLATARTSAQAAVDAAALAAASVPFTTKADLRKIAKKYVAANLKNTLAEQADVTDFNYSLQDRVVQLSVAGSIKTTFLAIAGITDMSYGATANSVRAMLGETELVMVLDNTWSMAGTKLDALKRAAEELVNALKDDPQAKVKIGVVPYGDYVNVGTQYRGKGWLSVPNDYSTTSTRTCRTLTTKQQCTRGTPRTCTRTVDGVQESYDCTPSTCTPVEVPPYESCSGGGTTNYKWYGCVGSRTSGLLRRTDDNPNVPYPGLLGSSHNCLNPIVPLTDVKSTVVSAVRGMIVNVGGYRPSTYIPAGLIWGVNLLSPTKPFRQGKAYDLANKVPRKAIVLMTDGANTMKFDSDTGKHVATSTEADLAATYDDMQAICDYAKSKKIEVFTVSFNIDEERAKTAMRTCASTAANNFDATNPDDLLAAFRNIAQSLTTVRLTR